MHQQLRASRVEALSDSDASAESANSAASGTSCVVHARRSVGGETVPAWQGNLEHTAQHAQRVDRGQRGAVAAAVHQEVDGGDEQPPCRQHHAGCVGVRAAVALGPQLQPRHACSDRR